MYVTTNYLLLAFQGFVLLCVFLQVPVFFLLFNFGCFCVINLFLFLNIVTGLWHCIVFFFGFYFLQWTGVSIFSSGLVSIVAFSLFGAKCHCNFMNIIIHTTGILKHMVIKAWRLFHECMYQRIPVYYPRLPHSKKKKKM